MKTHEAEYRHATAGAAVLCLAVWGSACGDGVSEPGPSDSGVHTVAHDAAEIDCAPTVEDESGVVFTRAEVAMYLTFSPLPDVPPERTNAYADNDAR